MSYVELPSLPLQTKYTCCCVVLSTNATAKVFWHSGTVIRLLRVVFITVQLQRWSK